MSVDRETPSKSKKQSYFCKICRVSCLNRNGLDFHCKDEEHIKMEETYCEPRSGKRFYKRLQDYILCPKRSEPLIGLQYIVQLYPEVNSKDAFKCGLCKLIGPLYFIIKHIESFKHRRNYLSLEYRQLSPLYTKRQSFYERNWALKEHALKVEQQEKTLPASKTYNTRIGIKSDFWKYNVKRQEILEEYKKKLSAYVAQKENILQYMETLVITSPEEATLIQNLTEELEDAMNVFNLNTMPRHAKSHKRLREQSNEDSEGRHSDNRNKRRSIWYEKEHKPSNSSLCSAEKQCTSDKDSATDEGITSELSRSASKDMLLKVTFSTGSKNEAKAADVQEHQESSTACPDKVSSDNISEETAAWCYTSISKSDLLQNIRAKHVARNSTDVAKWESLFANHRPEISRSIFSLGPKSPSLNTEVSSSVEKKENTRRASLDALSTYTLFSQEGHELGSAQPDTKTVSSPRSPSFKGPQHELKQVGNKDQESPCSSDTDYNEAGTTDDKVMHTKPEQHDDKCKFIPCVPKFHLSSGAETSCDQLSDVNANVAQASKSSHVLDASSEYSDEKACGSKQSDTKTDNQEADSNFVSNTLTSGKFHASGRQLSSEVLQLFKGKDTNSIVHILKTLSPFYPALQELDLEVFAKDLSKTGAITE